MSKHIGNLLLVVVLCMSLLIGLAESAQAQGPADPNIVMFSQLGQSDVQLLGPYDSTVLAFGLPADWSMIAGTELDLSLGVSFITPIESNVPVISGGTLTVFLNNVLLGVLALDETGTIERDLPIPIEAFTPIRDDGLLVLRFVLDARYACYSGSQMNVVIHENSYFTLPHESIQPDTSLISFPQPIYQSTFSEDSALVVVPDQPTPAELQAALTVAAGLGNFSGNDLILDLTTINELTTEQQENNHLIFVGRAVSLPTLGQLQLPLPASEDQFQNPEGDLDVDDGLVQMINSPWSDSHVILVVSGNTDQGTIKAAQAISTGVLRPNRFPNLAVVQEVQTTPVSAAIPTDRTLSDLGYEGTQFQNRGSNIASYIFNIPSGWTVTPDAHFELVYGHSALLNFNRSGIMVTLNNQPIGSVSMSDTSASQTINRVRIHVPASALEPGNNRLSVIANLDPIDDCTPPAVRGLWAFIWPESNLHLPLTPSQADLVSNLDLAAYPAPFVYNPVLGHTAFVLSRNDLESWRAALQIAAELGFRTNGPLTALSVFYGDEVPETERENYNLLVIGRPSQMPIVGEMNDYLPAPFLDGSDVASESNFQVVYRIPLDSSLGYIEMMPSPWNPDNIVLAVLGNTAQGLSWATLSLIDTQLRSQLAGNFAVINDRQIMTTDTRLASDITSGSTPFPSEIVVPPSPSSDPYPSSRPSWILPVIGISITSMILILVVVAIGAWSRARARRRSQSSIKPAPSSSIKKWFENVRNRRKSG